MILFIIILILIALALSEKIRYNNTKFKSDEDLMERFIVLEHRRYRKSINKQPIM